MSRVLLEDRQFLKDVTFGKTKVFVRYSLEEESDYKSNLPVYGFLKICSSGLRPLCLSWRRLDLSWSRASSSSCRRCAGAAWPGKSTGRASYDDNMTTFNDQEDGGREVGLGKVPQVQNENVSRPLIILTLPCIHRQSRCWWFQMVTIWEVESSSPHLRHDHWSTMMLMMSRYVNTLQKTFKDCRSMKVRASFFLSS